MFGWFGQGSDLPCQQESGWGQESGVRTNKLVGVGMCNIKLDSKLMLGRAWGSGQGWAWQIEFEDGVEMGNATCIVAKHAVAIGLGSSSGLGSNSSQG